MSAGRAVFVTSCVLVPVSALVSPSLPLTSSSIGARRSPRRLLRSSDRRSPPPFFLRSSLDETFGTEAAANNNNNNNNNTSVLDGSAITATSNGSNCSENDDNGGSGNQLQQEQLQEVLSSPDLLDPAAILDATIGISSDEIGAESGVGDCASAGDNAAVTRDASSLARASAGAAISKEEDLELSRQAIMKHIEMNSNDDDHDEEEEESSSLAELQDANNLKPVKLQQQQSTGSNNSVESTLSESTPSVLKILRYTIPAIGIWLCSPVLSMIDTAAVGLLSGTAQQAALNPAVSVTDYGALTVAFMYTATTNLIAAAVQEDKDDDRNNATGTTRPKTATTLITALKLALLVGSAFGLLLGASGGSLLRLLIGNDALDPVVFDAALRYVRVRALGMPATVVIGTAQSACLGMRDVKSPLYVLLAAAVINFFGDVLLVPRAGSRLFGGAAGAAWATVASQYAALLFFARWLTTSPLNNNDGDDAKDAEGGANSIDNGSGDMPTEGVNGSVVNVTQGIMELTGNSRAGGSRRKRFRKFLSSSKLSRRVRLARTTSMHESLESRLPASMMSAVTTNKYNDKIRPPPATRGFLSNGKLTLRKYLSFSDLHFDRSKAKEFLPFVVPVTTTSVGRISGYIAMSHVASSTLGTYDMAAHQIVFSIFCCLTPFVDALSQVAQSFVPAVFEAKERGRSRAVALRETVGNFRRVGVGFGAVLLGLVGCIPSISRYFTTDPIVLDRVNGAIPGLGLFLLVHGLMCAGEGTLLGQKDLKFLRNMYAIFFFTVPAYMLRLKHRALSGVQTVGIGTMWAAFSTYNLVRTFTWHLRLAQLQRRTERGAVAAEGKSR